MRHLAPATAGTSVAELASLRPIRDGLAWLAREKHWIAERHLEVCRIPAPTFFEQKRAEWIAAQFRGFGCDVSIDRAGNVLAFPAQNRQGPFIAVTAHLDTVLAPRRDQDVHYETNGALMGPGVSDNGAGLAALLALAAAVRATPDLESLLSSVVFVANVGEEGEGNLSGMRYLCRQGAGAMKFRALIVLDGPQTSHITCRALASQRFEVTMTGPGGHSWSDSGVPNAVHAIARAITLFSEHRANAAAPGPRSSYNFGIIDGGTSINAIPNHARVKVDLRSESDVQLDDLVTLLNACVERATEVENQRASIGRVQSRVKALGSRPAGELPETSPLLQTIRAVDAHLHIKAQTDCASTDANIPLSMGWQAVSLGTGGQGAGAHTAQEWFHPDGRDVGLQRILLTLCLLAHDAVAPGAR